MLPAPANWVDDPEYFTQLRKCLLNIACSRMPQAADAEEVVHQALQVLIENRDRLALQTTPLQYAIGTLKHKIVDYYRRQNRAHTEELNESLPDSVSPEEEYQTEELRRIIQKSIQQLSEECRRLFALLYLGLTLREMQERLNAPSIDALKMRTSRCRKGLKELLAQNGYRFEGRMSKVGVAM
jgi:RNA polymerase sigma factor (sigma-70 family)